MSVTFATYPSESLRGQICAESWNEYQNTLSNVIQGILSLDDAAFASQARDNKSLPDFLYSYLTQQGRPSSKTTKPKVTRSKTATKLLADVFRLVWRMVQSDNLKSSSLLQFPFLSAFARAYPRNAVKSGILDDLWTRNDLSSQAAMQKHKTDFTGALDNQELDCSTYLSPAAHLAKCCMTYSRFLLLDSDWLDAAASSYKTSASTSHRKSLAVLVSLCFRNLLRQDSVTSSIVFHQLHGLKHSELLKGMIESTPLLRLLQQYVVANPDKAAKAQPLLDHCQTLVPTSKHYITRSTHRHREKLPRDPLIANGMSIDRISRITHIQELFPDLGSGFISKALDFYDEDIEQTTAHLLEDDLPPELQRIDRTAKVEHPASQGGSRPAATKVSPPKQHSSEASTRRNVYDHDDFDRMIIDTSKLYLGRKDADLTADHLLAQRQPESRKAAIMAALAAFDTNDDERDDTYDDADVGGTVDTTFEDRDARIAQTQLDMMLFTHFKAKPSVFNRDAATRRSSERHQLKQQAQMTDEALEGWALMLSRDAHKQQKLQDLCKVEQGAASVQPALQNSSWKPNGSSSLTNHDRDAQSARHDDNDSGNHSMTIETDPRGLIRGKRGGKGPGGDVNKSLANQKSSAGSQGRAAGRGARTNHNRRDQRAKKMARGGVNLPIA